MRRTFSDVKQNHLLSFLSELDGLIRYSEREKTIYFPNGSVIIFGYCANDRDLLRYQGQEYDIIALDEATQFSFKQFSVLSASLRGVRLIPRRFYLTCNPGGIGHGWVKRLFIDKRYEKDENPNDYAFISALVYDNEVLLKSSPDYVKLLESLPQRLKKAWLYGHWDVFEGQFFPEFNLETHTCKPFDIPGDWSRFIAVDYGFDMLAVLYIAVDLHNNVYIYKEHLCDNLSLSAAATHIAYNMSDGGKNIPRFDYVVASPDLWNRRQDSGKSGVSILQENRALPSIIRADDRRIPGWRAVRELLQASEGKKAQLQIFESCTELVRCLFELQFDKVRAEDASDQPHNITHAPEALRYAVMSLRIKCENNTFDIESFNKKDISINAYLE